MKELNTTQRNQNILKAIKDGYTQSEIGRHLGLSQSTISNIDLFKGAIAQIL